MGRQHGVLTLLWAFHEGKWKGRGLPEQNLAVKSNLMQLDINVQFLTILIEVDFSFYQILLKKLQHNF